MTYPEFVRRFRERLRSELAIAEASLKARHEQVTFEVFDWDIRGGGGVTADVSIGLDASFTHVGPSDAPSVSILVTLHDASGSAVVDFAGICWSSPCVAEECLLFSTPVTLDQVTQDLVVAHVPQLARQLSTAIERRCPPGSEPG